MAEYKFFKLVNTDGVARITLDRPKHNVFNIRMMDELSQMLEVLVNDKDLKCVVLGAEGKSWCAGVEVGDHKPELVGNMVSSFNRALGMIAKLEVPTIAAVHGVCVGGGMEFAIACDIVVASERAVFGQPEIKLGFFPPYAAIRLPYLIGPAKTIEVLTTGKTYSAEEGRDMGFVSHVYPEELFAEEVEKLIKEIKYNSPLIIRLNKQAVNQHMGMDFSKAVDSVSDLFLNRLMKTEDTLEGIACFEEKRRPSWTNK